MRGLQQRNLAFIRVLLLMILGLCSFVPGVLCFVPDAKLATRHHHRKQTRRLTPINPQCFLPYKSFTSLSLSDESDDGPDPSILISAQDDQTQRLAFVAAFAALAVGTNVCIQLWYGPGKALLGETGFESVRGTAFPIAFGIIFAVVGVLHFVYVDNFSRIVPPKGTWGGLWQAPAPFAEELGISYKAFHSYWTGVAEIIGGSWLLAGGLGLTSVQTPAFLLFLLTIGVTPANLYMFTHDADPGAAVPRLSYPAGHIARFVLQCGLLSNFWIMANS